MLSVIPTNLQSQSWFQSLSFPRFFNLLNILSSTPTRPQIYIHASCLNGLSSSTALNLLPATCWQRCSRLQLMPLSFKILAVSTCYHKEKKIKKGLIKMKKKINCNISTTILFVPSLRSLLLHSRKNRLARSKVRTKPVWAERFRFYHKIDCKST